jgi:6-phosphofructokinase 1
MMDGEMEVMNARSVSNIIQRGGTILKSARSMGFMTVEGRQKAFEQVKTNEIDALVTIGGNGTFTGAHIFSQEFDIPVIGLPGTIDNDLAGTDFTIGYDTACNRVIDAIDAIRDTASSHNRLFFIEVMGRHSGFIALRTAISAGVEAVIIPEMEMSLQQLMDMLAQGKANKKTSSLVVVAEGSKIGSATEIAAKVNEKFPEYDTKVTVLGHLQRGGIPTCTDREIASRMGVAAVEGLLMDKSGVMVGIINNQIAFTPFSEVVGFDKSVNLDLFRVNEILSV